MPAQKYGGRFSEVAVRRKVRRKVAVKHKVKRKVKRKRIKCTRCARDTRGGSRCKRHSSCHAGCAVACWQHAIRFTPKRSHRGAGPRCFDIPEDRVLVMQHADEELKWLFARTHLRNHDQPRFEEAHYGTAVYLAGVMAKLAGNPPSFTASMNHYARMYRASDYRHHAIFLKAAKEFHPAMTVDVPSLTADAKAVFPVNSVVEVADVKSSRGGRQRRVNWAQDAAELTYTWIGHHALRRSSGYEGKQALFANIRYLGRGNVIHAMEKPLRYNSKNAVMMNDRDKMMLFTHVIYVLSNYGTDRLQFVDKQRMYDWNAWCWSWFRSLTSSDNRTKCNIEVLAEVATCLLIIHKQDRRVPQWRLPNKFWKVMWGIMQKGRANRGQANEITKHTGYYRCHQSGITKRFEVFHTYAVLGMLFGVIRNLDK